MLTDSEREWLKTRDKKRPYCFYCEAAFGTDFCYWKCVTETCAMYPDMKDAAEFSERVAALLAEIMPKALADSWFIKNAKHINADATLKWAQLSVEEEIDAES